MHTFVPYLRAEVAYLMSKRRREVAARIRIDHEDEAWALPRCSLTGRVLFDGVARDDEHGVRRLYNRKDALVRFPDAPLREAAHETAIVQRHLDQVTYETWPERDALKFCAPWHEQMPMDGILAAPNQI